MVAVAIADVDRSIGSERDVGGFVEVSCVDSSHSFGTDG